MPATKPTSSGAVALQTGHANYANLVRAFSFLNGSGTTITDHKAVGNLALTIDGAGGGWNTSTTPYSVAMAHNNGTGGATYFTGSHFFDLSLGATVFCRVKINSLDPTNGVACPIFTGGGWGSAEPTPYGVSMMIKQDNNLYGTVSVNGGWRKSGYVPITLGQWVTLCFRYNYNGASGAGEVIVFKDGASASGAQTTNGDRPGQFNDPEFNYFASGKMSDASTEAGWAGEFDVLYIFNTALSDADILALHNDPYAVIAAGEAPPVSYDETAVGSISNYVGGAPTMVVDGSGSGQQSGKPTAVNLVDLQTSHPLYASLTHVWPFLDGSGTTVTECRNLDGLSDDNLTLTLSGSSTWETSVNPRGYNLVINAGGNNDYFRRVALPVTAGVNLAYAFKCKVNATEPGETPAILMSSDNYNSPHSNRIVIDSNNKLIIGFGYQHGYRQIVDIPYTLGTELRVIMSYDFAAGVTTAWVNGTKYTTPATNGAADIVHGDGARGQAVGDKPGSFGTAMYPGLNIGRNLETANVGGWTGFIDVLYRFNAPISDANAALLDGDFYSLITANSGSSPALTYDETGTGATANFVGGAPLFSGHGVLANDTSNLGPLTISSYTQPTNGVLTLNPNGTGEWDSNGFMGSTTFTYRATDGTDTSAPVTVTLVASADQDLAAIPATLAFVGGLPTLDINVSPNTFNQLAIGAITSFVGGTPGLVTNADTTYDQSPVGFVGEFVSGRPRLSTSTFFYGFNYNNPYNVRVISYSSSGVLVLGNSGEGNTFIKQPADTVLLDVMCDAAIGAGENIQLVYTLEVVSASDGNLTSLQFDTDPTTNGTPAVNTDGDTIQTLVSGGTNGVTYKVRALVTTNFAAQKEFDFYIMVKDV